ncbi:hypothetical protein CRE_24389 [Caenorhabditis remanei]|uniref:Uncharacterized protein n=1 Tax=Caenorhabditis remanei TaxID=31234 RepID=E3MFQ8_CAERE|nr:hypothetical protein CRE_24389 [Caenorhabditis remanei]
MTSIKRNGSYKKAIEDAETAVVILEDQPDQSTSQAETDYSKFVAQQIAELEKRDQHYSQLYWCLKAHEIFDEQATLLERLTLEPRETRLPRERMREKLKDYSIEELEVVFQSFVEKYSALKKEEEWLARVGISDSHVYRQLVKQIMQEVKMMILKTKIQFRRLFSKKV